MRKAIAKVLTVLSEKRIHKAHEEHKKGKTPHDLRHKKTRAFRKKMTKFELSQRTLRQHKKESNFRQRKFALAA